MPTILITGAARGLGLEFVRQYAAAGWRVLATVRDPLSGKAASDAGAEVYVADMADPASLDRLAAGLGEIGLDVVLANAGLYGTNQDFGAVDAKGFLHLMQVNVLAPLHLAEVLADRMAPGGIIAAISSKMGSIAENTAGGNYAYRASKAALNMVLKSMALDLKDRGIRVVALSPGWVRTDMGGAGAPLSAEQAVSGLRQVLAGIGPADSGSFLHYDGTRLPW